MDWTNTAAGYVSQSDNHTAKNHSNQGSNIATNGWRVGRPGVDSQLYGLTP